MKTTDCRWTAVVLPLLLSAAACNRPGLVSNSQALTDTGRQWQGKGFGFVWDEATPDTLGTDSPVRFSGVAYSCSLDDFYANVGLSGPISPTDLLSVIGSAAVDPSDVALVAVSPTVSVYGLDVPMTGSVNTPNGVCDAQVVARFSVQVDLEAETATFMEATAIDGVMLCTHESGISINISIPTMALPRPVKIPINVLETEACQQDLRSEP